MANTLKSQMILNNATADIPAAGTAGRHGFDTTLLTPYYDNGTANVPWRASVSIPIITPTGAAINFITGAAYAAVIANGGMYLDFTRFRQARLVLWGAIQVASVNAKVKIVDTTNTQDISGEITLNSVTPARKTTSWGSLNSATYAGDAEYELQAIELTGADVIKLYSAQLELR